MLLKIGGAPGRLKVCEKLESRYLLEPSTGCCLEMTKDLYPSEIKTFAVGIPQSNLEWKRSLVAMMMLTEKRSHSTCSWIYDSIAETSATQILPTDMV